MSFTQKSSGFSKISLFIFLVLSLSAAHSKADKPIVQQAPAQQELLQQPLTDALGQEVLLRGIPKRIVTLAPSLGELVSSFLGTELQRIVGVSEYTDYPSALQKVSSIGPYHRFSIEKVLALKPDLVLATTDGNPKDSVLRLRELGLQVLTVQTNSFAEIEESMILIAKALGVPDDGARMAKQFHQEVEQLQRRSQGRYPYRVLIQLGEDPLIVVSGKTFINTALVTTGARNIYADDNTGYPRPSVEDVLKKDPEVILILTFGKELKKYSDRVERWKQFPQLTAVKKNQIYLLSAEELVRPTARVVQGIRAMEKAIYHP